MKNSIFQIAAIPITIGMLIISSLLPKTSQAQYTKLYDFTGTGGSGPGGDLLSDGVFLYGMTAAGGTSTNCTGGCGTVFKVKPDGTGFVKLLDFDGTNGRMPLYNSLISDGTYLYGMTTFGGSTVGCTEGCGVIFKIKPDGTGYTKLHDLLNTEGSSPYGNLIFDGTDLYGVASSGSGPPVFKIKPDGTGFTVLKELDGATPGSLVSDGTYLYGVNNNGGLYGKGIIFKVLKNGTGYAVLLDFDGTNGSGPFGSLIIDGTNLYGMTTVGGTSNFGVVYKIKTDGTSYSKLLDFNGTNGKTPEANSLILAGTTLYGMTKNGGTSNTGVIFRIMPDGTDYMKLYDFTTTSNGVTPKSSLISDGTFFYGMAGGGTSSFGAVFKYQYCSTTPLVIASSSTYNGTTWSTNVYPTITIGTGTSITATTDQVFKYSNSITINGPFSTGSNTISILPRPCQ